MALANICGLVHTFIAIKLLTYYAVCKYWYFLKKMATLKQFLSQLNKKGAKGFQDFCESTSLHGYSYLYIAQSKLLMIFWVIVLITMTSLGVIFLVDNTMDYIEADVVTTIKSFTANLSVSTYYHL